ncbi:MAG: hypothetical protein ACP5H0_08030, partial [Caldisericum sp.]|uniref:hypothetical protein n=1 Tax=Caldisericum sp. TaxID=2499687 RepID=UPI003D0CE840
KRLRNLHILRGQQPPLNTPPKIHQRIVNPRNEVTRILLLLEELEWSFVIPFNVNRGDSSPSASE